MKKFFALFVAVAFALSLAVMAVAAEEKKAARARAAAAAPAAPAKAEPAKAAPAAPAAPMKAEPMKKEAAKKAKPKVVTGTIEALDAAAGTFSVKGKKETVQLKAGEKVKLDGRPGHRDATYSQGTCLLRLSRRLSILSRVGQRPPAMEIQERWSHHGCS